MTQSKSSNSLPQGINNDRSPKPIATPHLSLQPDFQTNSPYFLMERNIYIYFLLPPISSDRPLRCEVAKIESKGAREIWGDIKPLWVWGWEEGSPSSPILVQMGIFMFICIQFDMFLSKYSPFIFIANDKSRTNRWTFLGTGELPVIGSICKLVQLRGKRKRLTLIINTNVLPRLSRSLPKISSFVRNESQRLCVLSFDGWEGRGGRREDGWGVEGREGKGGETLK